MLSHTSLREHSAQPKPSSNRKQHSDEALSRFFANSLSMLCIAGFDGYFKRLSPAWKTTLGWTLEDLRWKPLIDFVHADDRSATLFALNKLARGSHTVFFENRYLCKDGSYKWLHWSANSLRARQRIYALASDIMPRKNMQREVLQASDLERARLGRELHDGLCQKLAGIAALSSALSRNLAADSKPAAAAANIARLLNETIHHARELAHGLDPEGLTEIGLAGALDALASNVEALFDVSCTFHCHVPLLKLGAEIETHLYRIAQESLHNAITHGRGRRLKISLSVRAGKGLLSIHDDGVGMPKNALKTNGIGLHAMDYRAHLIGGSLKIQRIVPCGTAVTCEFRLPPDARQQRCHGRKKN